MIIIIIIYAYFKFNVMKFKINNDNSRRFAIKTYMNNKK